MNEAGLSRQIEPKEAKQLLRLAKAIIEFVVTPSDKRYRAVFAMLRRANVVMLNYAKLRGVRIRHISPNARLTIKPERDGRNPADRGQLSEHEFNRRLSALEKLKCLTCASTVLHLPYSTVKKFYAIYRDELTMSARREISKRGKRDHSHLQEFLSGRLSA